MMASVRSKNSRAEMFLRRELHRRGLRYRLHRSDLVGKPDIVFPRQRLVVFVDGDFWHGHAWVERGLSSLEEMFPNNTEFWVSKIRRNEARDEEVTSRLRSEGWKVIRIWESEILRSPEGCADEVVAALAKSNNSPSANA
jgi:DNA mismatch endonuclease (patch repair protein)